MERKRIVVVGTQRLPATPARWSCMSCSATTTTSPSSPIPATSSSSLADLVPIRPARQRTISAFDVRPVYAKHHITFVEASVMGF